MTTTTVCLKGRQGEFGPALELAPARDVVYVGRPAYQGGWRLPASQFANPFRAQRVGGAAKAVELYRERLRGKRLGCWCAGPDCHARALAEIAEGAQP